MLCCKLKIFYYLVWLHIMVATFISIGGIFLNYSKTTQFLEFWFRQTAVLSRSSLSSAVLPVLCYRYCVQHYHDCGVWISSSTGIAFTMQATDLLSIQMVNVRFSAIADVTRNATANSSRLNCGSRLWNLSLKMTLKAQFCFGFTLLNSLKPGPAGTSSSFKPAAS